MKCIKHVQWSYFTGSIRGRLKYGWRITHHCTSCHRRRWAEEIIGGMGWCDRCFNASYDAYRQRPNPDLT